MEWSKVATYAGMAVGSAGRMNNSNAACAQATVFHSVWNYSRLENQGKRRISEGGSCGMAM